MFSRSRRVVLSALVLAACSGADSFAAGDAQAVLAESDAVRNPSQPFRMTVTIVEYERAANVGSSVFVSYARTLDRSGQFATILRYSQPTRDAGKILMKSGNDLWFYDPGTKAAVRISPQQRLMGQAANGDVVTVNFARDYQAAVEAEEAVQDGERKRRNAIKLKLAAANQDATYASIELWVDRDTSAPIKARFFADSGRLLKTAYYRRYQQQLGAERPTETVIIDGIDPQSVTIIRFSDYQAKVIPATWFHRDYLQRFAE